VLVSSRRIGAAGPTGRPSTTDDDVRLFETEMQGVKPLARGRERAVPDWDATPEASPALTPAKPRQAALHIEVNGEQVSGTAFGVARDLLRDLAAGRMAPEAEMNLHHAPADSAVHRTQRFVELSRAQGRRCVLVIHGRGQHSGPSGPVLLPALLEALGRKPLADQILAVTTAPQRYGGSGAMLLLLRKSADQK
jgi:DNA-nicking Smr family endonuclease